MKPELDAPADTQVMGIVHSALRRDLLRADLVLAMGALDDRRRVELADHLLWMTEWLHILGPRNRHHFADLWKGTAAETIPSQQLSFGS